MIIQSQGIILKVESFKEKGLIVRCFTKDYGKLSGFMRAPTKKLGFSIIPGNLCFIIWKARLEEHLGNITLEITESIFHKTSNSLCNNIVIYITAILEINFQEKSQSQHLYNIAQTILIHLDKIDNVKLLELFFLFEVELLNEMGYGMNLIECAITKKRVSDELYYMSPKTGAACTKEAGAQYSDKLFVIPKFFLDSNLVLEEINEVSQLLQHFLVQHDLISSYLLEIRAKIVLEAKETE